MNPKLCKNPGCDSVALDGDFCSNYCEEEFEHEAGHHLDSESDL